MNIYFLVEGDAEKKVYPAWLKYLVPELQSVKFFHEVDNNNYYLFNAKGNDSLIKKHLPNAIADIQDNGKYNFFVICIDAEDVGVDYKKQEIYSCLNSQCIDLGNTKLIIIIQNPCIETWCLGNRKIYSPNPQNSPLREYTSYYNVSENCPELMGNYHQNNTHAQFHKHYLKEIFKAKGVSDSKQISTVSEQFYLNELIKRVKNETEHLPTFQTFIQFCNMIKSKL